jgi:hypothetical protein
LIGEVTQDPDEALDGLGLSDLGLLDAEKRFLEVLEQLGVFLEDLAKTDDGLVH